jgi:enoyl-CoA hydratase/carnithine racemase
MGEPCLRYDRLDAVACIRIDHPDRLNAMSFSMWQDLSKLVARAEADETVRVITLEGSGEKAFCAGADISQFNERRSDAIAVANYESIVSKGISALTNTGKPTVALVKGICFGGGFILALSCDLRFVREDARFRIPAARLGIGYAASNIELMLKKLGVGPTSDILMSARILATDEALRLGVASRVWSHEIFEEAVTEALKTIASNAPLTLKAIKRGIVELMKSEKDRNILAVDRSVSECFESDDYREGQAAFREKREPSFQGR